MILNNGDRECCSLDNAGDYTAMFDISTIYNTTHEVIRFFFKTNIDEDKFLNGCCYKRCNCNVCLGIRYVQLDVFLNFLISGLVRSTR
jgi:hypothetical protein